MGKIIHVAAAVIHNAAGEVLIAKRPDHVHMGGYWEFPGGKLEANEPVKVALARELEEELGIRVSEAAPLIQVQHHYPDKSVLLDVWRVHAFSGDAIGREGQAIKWVPTAALDKYRFPDANLPIVKAARLPNVCHITGTAESLSHYVDHLKAVDTDSNLVLLRPWRWAEACSPEALLASLKSFEHYVGIRWFWHADFFKRDLHRAVSFVEKAGAGLHLPSALLAESGVLSGRQIPLSASCHNTEQLQAAESIGAEFALLSPVRATKDYAPEAVLQWSGFESLARAAKLPVYGLGGLGPDDLSACQSHGGQGVAMVRAWWRRP